MWLGLVMYDLKWSQLRYAHIWSRITHRTTFSSKTNTLETLRATRKFKRVANVVFSWGGQMKTVNQRRVTPPFLQCQLESRLCCVELWNWYCGTQNSTKTCFFEVLVARNVSGVFVLLEKVVRCVILDQIFAYLSRDHLRLSIWTLYTRRDPDVRWTHS